MKQDYNFTQLEKNWQKEWEDKKIFSPDVKNAINPYYNLMMFPYPSAEGLHVGNMYAFTGADVYAKFQRMQGKDVLEPIGLDGFGIHSENYAIKVGRHPKEQAQIAEKNYYRQLKSIGNSFDWQRTVETYDPDYYRWTQWIFVQMFKNGLAYRKKAQVNWCPSDKTVLSDEQVIDGKCERCSYVVEKRELEQWFFRITKYADRLIDNLSKIDWVEKVKIAQKQWIGKSEGAEIKFIIDNSQDSLTVFTTRPDTLYGATFMVIAPEHSVAEAISNNQYPLSKKIITEVEDYLEKVKSKSEINRTAEEKEKTGVFSGLYAINPANSKKIPIYIADYVLSGYGTGAIMAVPAHDPRDFEFAKKYNLPIIQVVKDKSSNKENKELAAAFEGKGEIIGSEDWNGFHAAQDMSKILDSIEAKGIGVRGSHYHLRDWLISRQRYWGPPIPMIFCQKCYDTGKNQEPDSRSQIPESQKSEIRNQESEWDSAGWYTVPEQQLPVLLPDVPDWRPEGNGLSPLANHPEFFKTQCPECGGDAKRETDVSDTFLDSAWYFLRYPSIGSKKLKVQSQKLDTRTNTNGNDMQSKPFDTEITKKWLPVDMYIGGAEHSVLHLLYARFVTMVLKDLNFIDFEEPFTRFFAHGLIIKDGAKMSKSKGNVVVPDEYIKKYGADALRTYLMFLGSYEAGGDFSDSGIEGVYKFLKRVWVLFYNTENSLDTPTGNSLKMMHKTVKKVTNDVSRLSYNTAIAALMEWYNFIIKQKEVSQEEIKVYLQLLAPFAPHMTEHLFQMLRNSKSEILNSKMVNENSDNKANFESIHLSSWPEFDEKLTQDEQIVIVVQVNGKKRGEVIIQSAEISDQNKIEKLAKEKIIHHLEGKDTKKVIYIPGKILNFVVAKV